MSRPLQNKNFIMNFNLIKVNISMRIKLCYLLLQHIVLIGFLLNNAAANAADNVVFASSEPTDAFLFTLKESIVKISSSTRSGGHGWGTGVAISKDHVVTNCHVIQNSDGISMSKWGESFAPTALLADWKHDICILRFEWANLKPVPVGDSEALKYEQPVVSISMPGDSPAPYVALGKVKALYPLDDAHVIRASAQFAIGASGSPVFDYDGKLIGISTVKSPGQKAYFYNMPAKWIKDLLTKPEVKLSAPHEAAFWDAPDEKRPSFMRVVLPYQNEKWDELKIVAQDWINKEPTSPEALFYAGAAAQGLGDLKAANDYFVRVLALQPNHPATLMALGLMANKAGKTEEVAKTRTALKAIDANLDEEFTAALNPEKALQN
jgi:serine protease Do